MTQSFRDKLKERKNPVHVEVPLRKVIISDEDYLKKLINGDYAHLFPESNSCCEIVIKTLCPKDFKRNDIVIFLSFGCIKIFSCKKAENSLLKDSYIIQGERYKIRKPLEEIETDIQDKQYLVIRREA
jgi:hypothetical protein